MSKLALFTFLIGIFLCTQLVAQETPRAATDEAKKATVEGQVLNQVTKEALKRVDVRMLHVDKNGQAFPTSAAAYSAVTDAEGKFHFEDVEPGQYRVNYRKAGFVAGRGGFGAMGGMNLVTAKAGETHGGLRYYLSPQGVVTGRVLDDEGEPLQGVRVMLIRPEYTHGMQRLVPHGQAPTNDRGEYRITDVVPGKYYILANVTHGFSPTDGTWGPAAPPKPGAARVAYVSTYFPNASDQAQAIRVTVAPGLELSEQDIVLRREKVVKLVGKLVWPGGAPVANVHVIYVPRETTYYSGGSMFATDEKGVFTIDEIQPGDYALMAHSDKDAAGMAQQRVLQSLIRLHVGDRDVENVTLEWQPEAAAGGAFIVEGSDGKAADLAGCMFSLYSVEFNLPMGSGGWAKSDGKFELDQLLPIRFNPGAVCPGGNPYVKSILVGDEDVLGKETDGAAVAAAGVKVIVRTDVASVSGTLSVPEEEKGALERPLVALLATDARLRYAGGIDCPAVDQEYHFQSRNLRPGEYLAWAFEEGDINSFSDPEFYRLMESKGAKVKLAPGESQTVDLKLTAWPAEFADRLQ